MIELLMTAACLYWTALPGVDAYEVCWTGPVNGCAVVERWSEDWAERCGCGGPPGDKTWLRDPVPVPETGQLFFITVEAGQ